MKYLDLTLPTAEENIACDEQLLTAAESGEGGEVLRVWESPRPFVVVGYANRIETEVRAAAYERRGIPILRRCSGGGTVVQGPGCLSYALILKIADHPALRQVATTNRHIMEHHRAAIESLLPARHSHRTLAVLGHTDLALVDPRRPDSVPLKCSGNAQRRRRRFILFHGTFLLHFDLALVEELLPLPSRQPAYRQSRSHADFLVNLELPAETVKAALRRAWKAA